MSVSESSSRITKLNAQIIQLQQEKVDVLRQELAEAEATLSMLNDSSGAASDSARSVKPARKKRGARIASLKKKKSKRGSTEDRLQQAIAVVKGAGKEGISAKQLSEQSGIPYSAIRKLLAESGRFQQKGEKRASRVFLK